MCEPFHLSRLQHPRHRKFHWIIASIKICFNGYCQSQRAEAEKSSNIFSSRLASTTLAVRGAKKQLMGRWRRAEKCWAIQYLFAFQPLKKNPEEPVSTHIFHNPREQSTKVERKSSKKWFKSSSRLIRCQVVGKSHLLGRFIKKKPEIPFILIFRGEINWERRSRARATTKSAIEWFNQLWTTNEFLMIISARTASTSLGFSSLFSFVFVYFSLFDFVSHVRRDERAKTSGTEWGFILGEKPTPLAVIFARPWHWTLTRQLKLLLFITKHSKQTEKRARAFAVTHMIYSRNELHWLACSCRPKWEGEKTH